MNNKIIIILFLSIFSSFLLKVVKPSNAITNFNKLYTITGFTDATSLNAITYNINSNDVIISTTFAEPWGYTVDSILSYDSDQDAIIIICEDDSNSKYYLLSCGFQKTTCQILETVSSAMDYTGIYSPFFFIDKVAYVIVSKGGSEESNPNYFTLSLNFNTGLSQISELNLVGMDYRPSTTSSTSTYNTLNNLMYIVYYPTTNYSPINILTYDLSTPSSTQEIYSNIGGVHQTIDFMFTDSKNQLYILGSDTTDTNDWMSVSLVSLENKSVVKMLSVHLGSRYYMFTQYMLSQDREYLIFFAPKDLDQTTNLLNMTLYSINNGFSSQSVIIECQPEWLNDTSVWSYFLY